MIGDPYQSEPVDQADAASRSNAAVFAEPNCKYCDGSTPESDEFSWKYAAAGGCLVGPFCCSACYWGWLTDAE